MIKTSTAFQEVMKEQRGLKSWPYKH